MEKHTVIRYSLAICGDEAVGKTSIARRAAFNEFIEEWRSTIGAEFWFKEVFINTTRIVIIIHDLSGRNRFKFIRVSMYPYMHAIMIVYDVSYPKTFNSVISWYEEVREYNTFAKIYLVGNKIDLERRVRREDAEELARRIDAEYLEVSAKNGTNIELLFEKIANDLYQKG